MNTTPPPTREERLERALRFILSHELDGRVGVYEASTDYALQQKTHNCTGCHGVGVSQWPQWETQFVHEPDCKWIDAQSALHPAADEVTKS